MSEPKIGVIIGLYPDREKLESKFKMMKELELTSCQLSSWQACHRTPEMAEVVKGLCREYGIEVSCLWTGWTPEAYWNFYEGQETLGLVPPVFREHRLAELRQAIGFAKMIGTTDLTTHVGFMPENPYDPNYHGVIVALRMLCQSLKNNEMYFNFETGQETPVTLLRAIEDIGTGNIGLNLDPANLILYGKANPCDAMDVFGDYVRGIHVKDGLYPTDGRNLGKETRVGDGKVNFPKLIGLLNEHHYKGHFTIEREIAEGEQQRADIIHARDLVRTEYAKYEW
jgi:sugar phosphate isomerase/epimerase